MDTRKSTLSIADFQMPDSAKMEDAILSSIVASPEELYSIQKIVKAEYFSTPDRSEAWKTICQMDSNRETINLFTIKHRVSENVFGGIVEQVSSALYGRELIGTCYALAETHIKRMAYLSAIQMLQKVTSPNAPVSDILGLISGLGDTITDAETTGGTQTISEAINDVGQDLQEGNTKAIPTGFPSMDSVLYGGFRKGNLVILAARPSVGKTAVALYMAKTAAMFKYPAFIASLEMSNAELAQRYLSATEKITAYQMATGNFEWQAFEDAAREYDNRPIYINDKIHTVDEICSEIRAQVRKGHCKIAFVDYLGLIRISGMRSISQVNLSQMLGDITGRLKALAKELEIPIVLLCQLNRNSASQNREPELYDLRDSGSIEQDADIVLMLSRPKNSEGEEIDNMITMWMRKVRNGKRDIGIQLTHNDSHTVYNECGLIH